MDTSPKLLYIMWKEKQKQRTVLEQRQGTHQSLLGHEKALVLHAFRSSQSISERHGHTPIFFQ